MPLDRHAQRLLKMLALAGPGGHSGAERRRHDLSALRNIGEVEPDASVHARDLQAQGAAGALDARLYVVEDAPAPGLLYLHGGGWVAGDLETHDGFCRRLARASGCRILSLGYRLAPEHPFPAGLEDALAAFRWLSAHASELGMDPARLGLGGDSAGATLAVAASIALAAEGARPATLLLVCPILDIARESPSRQAYAEGYFLDQATLAGDLADYLPAGAVRADPRLSPLLAPDLTGLPPTLIHSAEFDPFRDEAAALAGRLAEAGVPVRRTDHPGMIHYFYALPRAIPYALEAARAIGAELGAALKA
jgi:acetyl esterase/lipase